MIPAKIMLPVLFSLMKCFVHLKVLYSYSLGAKGFSLHLEKRMREILKNPELCSSC
jgi:hypothetical protein